MDQTQSNIDRFDLKKNWRNKELINLNDNNDNVIRNNGNICQKSYSYRKVMLFNVWKAPAKLLCNLQQPKEKWAEHVGRQSSK